MLIRLSRRRVLVMAGGAIGATLLSGCGKDDGAGALAVGSTATGVPFTFLDVKSNKLVGAMVDIAQAVTQDAGLKIRIETTAFSALVPSLTARKIDIIAAAILRTPEREQVVAFTNPVYTYGGTVLLPANDTRSCPSLKELANLTVGAQVGTRFVDQLAEAGVTSVKTYDSIADIMRDLGNERIQAGYGDQPIIAYQLRTNSDTKLRIAADFVPPSREEVCLVTRKEDAELIEKLNASIARLKMTEIQNILSRWSLA